jgi:hypothetical protein
MSEACNIYLIYSPKEGWCWRTDHFADGADNVLLSANDMRAWARALLKSAAHMDNNIEEEDT